MLNKSYDNPTILKVDSEKRMVWGILASEQVDKDGEIMDFAASRPHWEAWSEAAKVRSAGKSLGNVRQMHNTTLPIAGKLVDIQFDEAKKAIIGCTHVTNDEAWKNVMEGVYTGYSLGGNYDGVPVKEAVTGHRRYTIIPAEVSLVDNPCNPDTTFDLICADGSIVKKSFVGKGGPGSGPQGGKTSKEDKAEKLSAKADAATEKANASGKEEDHAAAATAHADAATAHGYYSPDNTPKSNEHMAQSRVHESTRVGLARARLGKKDFEGKVTKEKKSVDAAFLTKVKEKIETATLLLKAIAAGEVKKGMYSIGSLANLICDLNYMSQDSQWEADMEGDGSEVPAMLKAVLRQLAEVLKAMTNEEVTELIGADEGKGKTKAMKTEITKKQADHLEQIGKIGKKIHAAHAEMGKHINELLGTNEQEDPNGEAETDEQKEQKKEAAAQAEVLKNSTNVVEKTLGAILTKLNGMEADNVALKAQLAEQSELSSELSNIVLKMAGEPAAAAMPKLQVVTKAQETAPVTKSADEIAKESKDPNEVMKAIRNGGPSFRVLGEATEKIG